MKMFENSNKSEELQNDAAENKAVESKVAENKAVENEAAENDAAENEAVDNEPVENEENDDEEVNTAGWDAITNAFEDIYPVLKNHYGTLISWQFGGNDPLEGISIYDGGDYWHFVTYGLSELYDKESDDEEYSGFGMEFTFKLKKDHYEDEESELKCICGILQAIARITFNNGEIFMPYEYLYTGQTQGIDTKMQSNITGFITIPDKNVKPLQTPNGKVEFVDFIGATDSELIAIQNKELTVKELYEKLGSDVTSYNRKSIV